MKTWKGILFVLLCCSVMVACGGGDDSASQSDQSTADLSSTEQAQLVAATLSTDQGGVGKDIATVAKPASLQTQASGQASLTVSAKIEYSDADGHYQDNYDAATTDHIKYKSQITGKLTTNACYFQDLSIDNGSEFIVDGLTTGSAVINGAHHNHSHYVRKATFNSNQVSFDLACDLSLSGVIVDMNTTDCIPEEGTIEGSIAGSYVRNGAHANISKQINFQFTVTYMGDNTAEIQVSGNAVFSVNLNTGAVTETD
ncbi:MAG: hypothetical protein M0036_17895 [Desulfobacteraceae bacterium]|nr:hypothetical protein [Desulfobacteraceae bacterium]